MHIPVDESPSIARNRNARACIIIGVRKPSAAGWLNLRKKDEMGCGSGFHLPFRCVWEGKNNKPFDLKRKKQTRRNYLLGSVSRDSLRGWIGLCRGSEPY